MSRASLARLAALVLATTATLSFLSIARAAESRHAPPGLELGESRPVETVLGNPVLPAAQDVWLDMIRGATRSLDFEEFYFSHHPGQSLQPIVDEIGRAAARGVEVRLLLDAGFHKTYPWPADSIGRLAHVSLRYIDYHKLAGGVQHSKFMIVDGRDAWIGSQNLDWRSLTQIHELGIRIRDVRIVSAIGAVYASDWGAADTTHAFAVGAPVKQEWPVPVAQGGGRSVDAWLGASPRSTTPAGIPWDRDLIVQRIDGAKSEIEVQVLQYGVRVRGGADSTLHRALIAAVARGVKVKLIVSDWALGGANEPALRDLAAHGVSVRISRVPGWSGGYVPFARVEHCKYMVVDQSWLWVGTSNWEPSYFLDTRNLGLTVHDPVLAAQARAVFEASWTAPAAAEYGRDTKLPPREHSAKAPAGAAVYGE